MPHDANGACSLTGQRWHTYSPHEQTPGPMKKWKQFAAIVATRRRSRSPDRFFAEFQQILRFLQASQIIGIRSYSWTISYVRRGWPTVNCVILVHHAATAAQNAVTTQQLPHHTAFVMTALESASEANFSVVATNSRKAFFSMVAQHTRR